MFCMPGGVAWHRRLCGRARSPVAFTTWESHAVTRILVKTRAVLECKGSRSFDSHSWPRAGFPVGAFGGEECVRC
jgi:hypothetical protein